MALQQSQLQGSGVSQVMDLSSQRTSSDSLLVIDERRPAQIKDFPLQFRDGG